MNKIVEAFFPEILILSGKNNIDNWQYWRVGFIFIKLHYRLYWFIVTFLTEFYCKNIHCRTLFQFKMLMEDSFVHKKNWHLKETVPRIFHKLINKKIFARYFCIIYYFLKNNLFNVDAAMSTSKYWTLFLITIFIKYIFKTSDQCSAIKYFPMTWCWLNTSAKLF